MGKIMKRKKKGRPSKSDTARRSSAGLNRKPVLETDRKKSIRRRNLTYTYEFDDDEEEDEEGSKRRKRREKKLKLVLKQKSSRNRDDGFSGVDSVTSQTTRGAEGRGRGRGRREEEDRTSSETSSGEYGNGDRVCKKRKINGDDDVYDDEEDDDDKGLVSFRDQMKQNKESGHNVDSKGLDSVLGGAPLPDRQELELILDKLQRKDIYGVFAEPVDPEELPDYHDVIEHPMDFETIRKRLANGTYSNLEDLEDDVFLLCSNAMQYNAPETIYFKQARSIQELAKQKFQKLRIDIKHTETEQKSEQKNKFNPPVKKPAKKSLCSPLQEPIGSDFSSGATLATMVDICTLSNLAQAGECERPSNVDEPINENSSLTENKSDEAEEQLSEKDSPSKFGGKHIVIDENRRLTYNISNQPVVSNESLFTIFEGETEQLVAVGLHGDHPYARSVARFAATLGPVAWKVASWRIEKALPAGMKFGRGWVGEYEPLPTPVLMVGNHTKERATNSQKMTESRVLASNKSFDPAKEFLLSRRSVPESKPPLFGVGGGKSIFHATNQPQNQLTMNFAKSGNIKQIELKSAQNISSRNQFEYDSETKPSRQLEMVSQNKNLMHSIPFNKQETDGRGTISTNSDRVSRCSDLVSNLQARAGTYSPRENHHQGLTDHNQVMRLSVEKTTQPETDGRGTISTNSDRVSRCSDLVSNLQARAGTYSPRGNRHQGLIDHNQVMRLSMDSVEKTQQTKFSNPPTIDTRQVMVSAPSLRRDDSSTAANAAARAWMSLGATQFKPLESPDPPRVQITAASPYNPAREFSQPVLQFHREPLSEGLQFHSLNRFHPQLPANEPLFQNNRQMVFPQTVTANLSQFQVQSPRQGLVQHLQTNRMLPPDLNICFQSSGSPVKRSSGIFADSQHPDLALQL